MENENGIIREIHAEKEIHTIGDEILIHGSGKSDQNRSLLIVFHYNLELV
jgi:hypothetical protein